MACFDMAATIETIEAKLKAAGGPARMYFAPAAGSGGGYRFALTGEIISGVLYRQIMARFAPTPPVSLDSEAMRRNRNRAHRRASQADESAR
jgi:hypothetical protein